MMGVDYITTRGDNKSVEEVRFIKYNFAEEKSNKGLRGILRARNQSW